ncbi:MAG: hypothetical protein FGM14_05640 [Flavobacteriales bacterium]|nr:hypothetical protein [Flavobacteriales bacterium]
MGKVIQFFHPGTEHNEDSGAKWHTGEHRRKFMKTKGSYVNESKVLNSGDIYFWGEWEAQSKLLERFVKSGKEMPHFLFEPYYAKENIGDCNTDPFVFGNQYYYCVCKQGHYKSMRELEKMDIILFGSHRANEFVLDALFVVKDFTYYNESNFINLKEHTNETYFDVSIAPIFTKKPIDSIELEVSKDGCITPKDKKIDESDNCMYSKTKQVDKYRNYRAVMYNEKDKHDGIFSFVPCETDGAFSRPSINFENIINLNQTQGIKISEVQNMSKFWSEITKQVFNQGLSLMVESELPKKRSYETEL